MQIILRAAVAVCLLGPASIAQTHYTDPQGRFHFAAPAGWTAEAAGEGAARCTRGAASCMAFWMQAAEGARALAAQVLAQAGSQWRNFQVVAESEPAAGGARGYRAAAVGLNPAGEAGVFQVTVAEQGSQRLLLVCSVRQADYAAVKSDLDSIERSLAFGPAQPGPPDAGLREKLEALEAACRATVLTPEECAARRKALVEQARGGRPQAEPSAAGPAARGALGIEIRDMTDAEAKALALPGGGGARIQRVVPGSPAAQAGMAEGDVLVRIDRQAVRSAADVVRLLAGRTAGESVEAGWISRGQLRTASIRLAGMPAPAAPARREGAAAPPQQAGRAADTIRLVRYSVRDPGVDNIEAVSFLIPAGWRTEGGIQWFPDYRILANLLLRISDPQTGAAIEFLPLQYFFYWPAGLQRPHGSNYLGRVVWPPIEDVGEFIQTMYMGAALARLRHARSTAVQEMPRLAELAAQSESGGRARAGRIRYEYEDQGQAWEEDVYVTLVYHFVAGMAMWRSERAYSFRAPKGLLDRMTPLMAAVVSTAKLNLDWFAQYAFAGQLFDERIRQGIRGAAALSETIRRNSEEIRQMYERSYRERFAAEDRIHRQFTEYIRGVETWRNPYEDRPVQLPSGYSNVWVNRSGEYILSNQAGFNPNVGSNIEWRPLERVQ